MTADGGLVAWAEASGRLGATGRARGELRFAFYGSVQRWNLPDGWVISRRPAHEALVSEADYIAAQDVSAARGPSPRADPDGPEKRRYLLAGLLTCGVRQADGVGMVEREARLPLPPRPHQRQRA